MYSTPLYCRVMYCTVLYDTLLYCTILHCTILYCYQVQVYLKDEVILERLRERESSSPEFNISALYWISVYRSSYQ